jgi:hypothetical protein
MKDRVRWRDRRVYRHWAARSRIDDDLVIRPRVRLGTSKIRPSGSMFSRLARAFWEVLDRLTSSVIGNAHLSSDRWLAGFF